MTQRHKQQQFRKIKLEIQKKTQRETDDRKTKREKNNTSRHRVKETHIKRRLNSKDKA